MISGYCHGQWMSQDIELSPGWNSVFLLVQPEPGDCDSIFAAAPCPVEAVCSYNSGFSSVQFVDDPSVLSPAPADWLQWLSPTNAMYSTRNLFTLQCGKPYLIKLAASATSTTWRVVGRPMLKDIVWKENAYNLVGFMVDTNVPLRQSFQTFFSGCPQLAPTNVFRLQGSSWVRLSNPSGTMMRSGEAFWIKATGYTAFQGALTVDTGQRAGLDYGASLLENTACIQNHSAAAITASVSFVSAGAPPTNGQQTLRAGDVPLSWWNQSSTNRAFGGWETFPTGSLSQVLATNAQWNLRLAIRRADMQPFAAPAGQKGDYQSLLSVVGSDGSRIVVPVHALGFGSLSDTGIVTQSKAGLWVGSALINKVNQPVPGSSSTNTPNTLLPVGKGAEFQFRVIVHIDTNRQARLMQHVSIMRREGSYTSNEAGWNVLAEPGRTVLVSDDSLVSQFSGSTLRDGAQVGRRISSAAFGFREPILSTTADPNGMRFRVATPHNDPFNPFLHRYHPDHDNLTENETPAPLTPTWTTNTFVGTNLYEVYTNTYAEASTLKSYTVTRTIEMQFTEQDPDGLQTAGWGDSQIGGIWRETITGLRWQALKVEGTFRLTRISTVGVLNDGM
ncbi:MAG: hypothetical protein C0404_03050 [Verrucomicrobia bacterium]|nr:hypothetical protein [Verrucomicrobiota bacterium]